MAYDWKNMTEEEYLDNAERQIWLSAFANNNPRAPAHKEVDLAYDEAKRRDKTYLYQRAWNRAYRSCGYEPSDSEIAAARGPREPSENVGTHETHVGTREK